MKRFSNLFKIITVSITFSMLVAPLASDAQGYQKTATGAKATVNGASVEVQFFSPEIVRIVKVPDGKSFTKESLSVIKKPEATPITLKQQGDVLNVRSSKLNVMLNLKTGEVDFAGNNGTTLLKEKQNSATFTPFNDAGSSTYTVTQAFVLDNDESIYGLGQHQRGVLNQRNQVYRT